MPANLNAEPIWATSSALIRLALGTGFISLTKNKLGSSGKLSFNMDETTDLIAWTGEVPSEGRMIKLIQHPTVKSEQPIDPQTIDDQLLDNQLHENDENEPHDNPPAGSPPPDEPPRG